MNLVLPAATSALAILSTMTAAWAVSLPIRKTSIADILWGPGFVLANWVYFASTPIGHTARHWLISLLVTVWGLRLSLHILWRNWGKPEDLRYARWRHEHGTRWWWYSYFQTFLLQGMLIWIISAPLLVAHLGVHSSGLTTLDVLGAMLWGIGFFFESVGDLQLARFRANPANRDRVLDQGLWRYTRHPNYFGDAVQWWGYYLIAAASGGWWTVFSPLLMTVLLLRVSGVALLERTLQETKPRYKEYVRSTSSFFPWVPRRNAPRDRAAPSRGAVTEWVHKWRAQARRLKSETFALYLAYRDPRVPWYAKALAACVVAYAFSPIDLIPDFVPILGYVDDLLLVPLGITLAIRLIPPRVMDECRERAQEMLKTNKRTNWIAGAIILTVWALLALIALRALIALFA